MLVQSGLSVLRKSQEILFGVHVRACERVRSTTLMYFPRVFDNSPVCRLVVCARRAARGLSVYFQNLLLPFCEQCVAQSSEWSAKKGEAMPKFSVLRLGLVSTLARGSLASDAAKGERSYVEIFRRFAPS